MGDATGRFRRSDRLLDSRDYRRVMRRGKRRANGSLVVISAPKRQKPRKNEDLGASPESGTRPGDGLASEPLASSLSASSAAETRRVYAVGSNRIGITASRKVGGAVTRNLFKRRIREWFRARRTDLGDNRDLVVIARRSGATMSLAELDVCLSSLLNIEPSTRWQEGTHA